MQQPITTRYNIDSCSMIVEFNASVWTARRLDKVATDEVVHSKGAAAKDAARVNKNLLAGRNELDVIQKHVNAVRTYVYSMTMPWSDSGQRLLPTTKFLEFNERMDEENDKFWKLVNDFVDVYPSLITAQAMALGDMFNRNDFPSQQEIAAKFDFGVGFLPVPTFGDFRVDVGNEAQAELQRKLTELSDKRVQAALQDVKDKLKDHLKRMSDRLTVDYINGEAVTRKFHNSLVEGAFDLCDMVKALNIVNDPDLESARKHLEFALVGVDAKELRTNAHTRTDVKSKVDDILSKFAL